MPFTLSHPAAVLILRRTGLPLAGLVAGSVAPDAPMISSMPYGYGVAHSVTGLVTVDLATGVVLALVWTFLVRAPLLDASPRWLRERMAVPAPLTGRESSLLPAAVILGASTHVLWDEFTHRGRWGATHVAWLADDHLGYAGYHWAQAASSVLGLAIVIVVGWSTLARRTPRPTPPRVPTLARWAAAIVVATSAALAIRAGWLGTDRGVHAAAIAAAVHGIAALAVGGVVAAAAWHVAARRAPSGRGGLGSRQQAVAGRQQGE